MVPASAQLERVSGVWQDRSARPRTLLLCTLLVVPGALSCAGRADVAPGPAQGFHCARDADQRLVFTVSNLGEKPARATTTILRYDGLPWIHLPTRPMSRNQSQTLTFPLPDQCILSTCRFEIEVDFKGEVDESDEENNQIRGECSPEGPLTLTGKPGTEQAVPGRTP